MPTIFYWRSDALKQYGSGWAIACADFASDARALIREQAPAYYAEQRPLVDMSDPDDKADFDDFMAELERDIAGEPKSAGCLLIAGSE